MKVAGNTVVRCCKLLFHIRPATALRWGIERPALLASCTPCLIVPVMPRLGFRLPQLSKSGNVIKKIPGHDSLAKVFNRHNSVLSRLSVKGGVNPSL